MMSTNLEDLSTLFVSSFCSRNLIDYRWGDPRFLVYLQSIHLVLGRYEKDEYYEEIINGRSMKKLEASFIKK